MAIERGDVDFIYQMFATTARDLAQTGQGKQLIKLSKYAGDQSVDGLALQKSFALMGHLVELDFTVAQAMALELEIEKESAEKKPSARHDLSQGRNSTAVLRPRPQMQLILKIKLDKLFYSAPYFSTVEC